MRPVIIKLLMVMVVVSMKRDWMFISPFEGTEATVMLLPTGRSFLHPMLDLKKWAFLIVASCTTIHLQ